MIALTSIPVELDLPALRQRAHVPAETADAEEFDRWVARARDRAKPKAVFQEAFVEQKAAETITLNGITFVSQALTQNLHTERVFAFVATCGRELDQIHHCTGDLLKDFWWETIKTSVLENAFNFLQQHLAQTYSLQKTATMSPGSGDAEIWPIEQQRKLFALLGNVEERIGVELTESCLMIPNKSVSGILFPTAVDFRTCQLCHRAGCLSRRAAFDPPLWQTLHPDAGEMH